MDFADWLESEMKKRAWRPSDLAKAAGLYQSTLGKVLNREREAGPDVCVSLADALKLPPEEVFRKAGLLPELPGPEDEWTYKQLLDYMRRLTPKERLGVLQYAFFRYQVQEGSFLSIANDENEAASDTCQNELATP